RYLEHPGAYDPKARLKEMDLMGIDQVMIIPTMLVMNYPFIENVDAAYALARAYNDWARDFCSAAPDRLFPAGWLPLQNVPYTCPGARGDRGDGLPGAARPADRRAGKVPELHLPERDRRRAHQPHGPRLPHVRGDGDHPRHAHLPGEQPGDGPRDVHDHPAAQHDVTRRADRPHGRRIRRRRRHRGGRADGRLPDPPLRLRGGGLAGARAALRHPPP